MIQHFYKQHYPSTKPKKDDIILVGRHQHEITAVIRFRHIEDFLLLTGMCVDRKERGQGLGHQVLTHCQHHILSDNVYCFALSHLESFYSKHQFVRISANQLPNSLKLLYLRYTQYGKNLVPMRYLE